ncbi:MAG: hypothetical protein A2008_13335 [Candidatus Wallbacteria bacterium GWC2_49_35]|uniref:Organic solvent tolerance-like N-terminal domain-containing protein n=1 Tax=Candidatus Wallbacteria bacterium GWC2_49_35 TaxID=1817813 RepID=A0A1F7WW16_9BACT|nr:MAG: hypothetical protein A2008_13335 [Candidatus Wallbacteria bacterium GWC2_49_35]HBC75996.1 hypothetical protein [Candidatus Wallbacteria bacterium]
MRNKLSMKEKRILKAFLIAASLFLSAVFALPVFAPAFAPALYAQQGADKVKEAKSAPAASPKKKQAIEITGDLFEMEADNTYVITGNVHVYQGTRTITCERGTYNEKTGIVRAFTNVEIVDEKFRMNCQRVDSHMKENYSLFSGGVIVNGKNFIANSERAFYYEKEEKAVLIGNPVAKSLDQPPNEVHGERIIYFMKTERMEVLNNVTALIQPKEKDQEGAITHITGNRLEILSDGRYQVTDNLRVLKKDMILYADRGIYDETAEITEAFGNVKVETSKYTMTSGYVKHMAKEDRTLANIKPKLIQIVDKKKRVLPSEGKSEDNGSDDQETSGGENEIASENGGEEGETGEAGAEGDKAAKKKISNKDKIILEANEIEALENSTHIIAKGDASLIQFPYLGQEGTEGVEVNSKINSQIMDIFTEEGKMVAKQDVVLTSKDITAYGDTATYYEKEDRLDIEGNAHAVQRRGKGQEDNDIVGKKITYFASTERILIKEPTIKFFQTSKEEKALPEIEKDTAPVRIKRKKAESTSEVAVGSTSEVAVKSTSEAGLNRGAAASTAETALKGAAPGVPAPASDKAPVPAASESARPRDPGANVRIKIGTDGAVSDVKVRDK